MTNCLFEKGREGVADGTIVFPTDAVKCVLVDLDQGFAKAVTGATNATPIVVTATAHGYSNGDVVLITGVLGNTAANGRFKIANVATNTFELTDYNTGANVAGNGSYTSGGWAMKISGSLNLSDIASAARIATSGNMASKTVTDGIYDMADFTYTAVAAIATANNKAEALVWYKDTGSAATSRLLFIVVDATNLPVTPNGGDISVTVPNSGPWGSAPGLFKL